MIETKVQIHLNHYYHHIKLINNKTLRNIGLVLGNCFRLGCTRAHENN